MNEIKDVKLVSGINATPTKINIKDVRTIRVGYHIIVIDDDGYLNVYLPKFKFVGDIGPVQLLDKAVSETEAQKLFSDSFNSLKID